MKYKVGDKVVIKNWDDMVEEFGLTIGGNIDCKYCFLDKMAEYCGKTMTIKSIEERGVYKMEEDGGTWNWSEDMFELEKIKFENGQLIETREGTLYVYLENVNNFGIKDSRFYNLETGNFLEIYDLDDSEFSDFDVMKIFELNYMGDLFRGYDKEELIERSKIIWSRDDFEIGDYIEVIDNGYGFTTYTDFFEQLEDKDLLGRYAYNLEVPEDEEYKIIDVAPHRSKYYGNVYVLENDCGQIFLIGEEGIKKI